MKRTKQKIMTFVEGTLLITMLVSVSALDGKNYELAVILALASVIGLYVCSKLDPVEEE